MMYQNTFYYSLTISKLIFTVNYCIILENKVSRGVTEKKIKQEYDIGIYYGGTRIGFYVNTLLKFLKRL